MSEYQYYEFQSIDRPLTEKERAEIGSWSSRTTPTSTQAIFTYSYSDFPKGPEKVVEKYFDAMLYLSNWGTKRLMFRLPRATVDDKLLKRYCMFDSVRISARKNHAILDICFDEEEGDWVEGEGWLSSLVMLRNDLMQGDLRIMYLAWLNSIRHEYDIEDHFDKLEPPVPGNLQSLAASLKSFIDFFEIDQDLISAASKASVKEKSGTRIDWERAVTKLSKQEQIKFLVQLAKGEQQVSSRLLKRLQEISPDRKAAPARRSQVRTIGELLKLAKRASDLRRKRTKQK